MDNDVKENEIEPKQECYRLFRKLNPVDKIRINHTSSVTYIESRSLMIEWKVESEVRTRNLSIVALSKVIRLH